MFGSADHLLGPLAVATVLVVMVFRKARERATRSARTRRRLILAGPVGVALGGLIAFWLPRQMRINIESPAAIFFFLVPWISGGGLIVLSLASALGAARAPANDEHRPPPA